MLQIRKASVLGAGTMGSRIAAHLANAGVEVLLLDLPSEGADKNRLARLGLESARTVKPQGFFTADGPSHVSIGNFDDDLPRLSECDWVIEAVTENLRIKQDLWARVEQVRKPGAPATTNTSGIPLHQIAEDFSEDLKSCFFGTHFFNPPRYLHLVEVIPGPGSNPALMDGVSRFCDLRLGKGVVPCKDTPNFIANRIGSFFGSTVLQLLVEEDLTIEEAEALTGPVIGLPKSATFRLLDIVGLDVWNFVSRNLYDLVPEDPWRERFLPPPFLQALLDRGWQGQKSGQGFYKRVGPRKEIHAVDWKTLEYHVAGKPKLPELDAVKGLEPVEERLRQLVRGDGKIARFYWRLFSDLFLYSASRIPEISDRVVEIDRAMRWGYNHSLGPFELWDALGVKETVERMEREGREVPESVERMLSGETGGFYRSGNANGHPRTEYFDLLAGKYQAIEDRPGVVILREWKQARGVIEKNAGASLIDLGDGVLCLEFHSKMNTLGQDQLDLLDCGIERTQSGCAAMVVANQGEHFSAGANLMLILMLAQDEEWEELDQAIGRFQQSMLRMKYAPRPIVAAPFNMTLGGGCELALHSTAMQASAELYMGLVEVGVGLIPGAGGTKEMILRLGDPEKALELIGYAKVSTSAPHARELGFLRAGDRISMNPERLIGDAKALALELARTYVPGTPQENIAVGGEAAYARMKLGIWMAQQGKFISDHDALIGEKLAYVLAGGKLPGKPEVSEQYLLDLEREAFLSLLGEPKTHERIQHMLKTGKPLRN